MIGLKSLKSHPMQFRASVQSTFEILWNKVTPLHKLGHDNISDDFAITITQFSFLIIDELPCAFR